jgi:hypothetical protein
MTLDTSITCSLSAAELPQRLAQMRAIGRDALLSVRRDGAMRFRGDVGTRERLEAVIAAESDCCSFLSFDLAESSGELLLTIRAPQGAEPVAEELVDTFAAAARAA